MLLKGPKSAKGVVGQFERGNYLLAVLLRLIALCDQYRDVEGVVYA